MWKRHRGVLGVDLAAEAMAVEDGVGRVPRTDAVADAVDGLDTLGLERLVGRELEVERVVGNPLGDEDDGVGSASRGSPNSPSAAIRPSSIPVDGHVAGAETPASWIRRRSSGASSVSSQAGATTSNGVASSTLRPSPASCSASAAATW